MESKPRDMDLIRLGARGFPWRPHKSAVDRSLAEVYRSTRGGAANRARVAEEADVGGKERARDGGPERGQDALVQKERLCRVACCRIVSLQK